ncbi:hypothetical protein [Nocardioides nanhaiensis]
MTIGHGDASNRLIEQRIRNRIIEYLGLAASFEAQREYEREVPIAHIPYEVINQWEDQVRTNPRENPYNTDIYDHAEVEALSSFQAVWDSVAAAVPENYPALAEVQAMPEWTLLRESAEDALGVLMRRGKFPEDSEID